MKQDASLMYIAPLGNAAPFFNMQVLLFILHAATHLPRPPTHTYIHTLFFFFLQIAQLLIGYSISPVCIFQMQHCFTVLLFLILS